MWDGTEHDVEKKAKEMGGSKLQDDAFSQDFAVARPQHARCFLSSTGLCKLNLVRIVSELIAVSRRIAPRSGGIRFGSCDFCLGWLSWTLMSKGGAGRLPRSALPDPDWL